MPDNMSTSANAVTPVFRLDFPDGTRLGRGKVKLLENIIATGSIAAAGRQMDMSYRRAWQLVEALNTMFDELVVDTKRGGEKGGGATVTPFGLELIGTFRQMEARLQSALEAETAFIKKHRKPAAKD